MKRCRVVAVDEACEGMQLHQEVRDRAGNVSLPRPTALSGAMIRSPERRGVVEQYRMAALS